MQSVMQIKWPTAQDTFQPIPDLTAALGWCAHSPTCFLVRSTNITNWIVTHVKTAVSLLAHTTNRPIGQWKLQFGLCTCMLAQMNKVQHWLAHNTKGRFTHKHTFTHVKTTVSWPTCAMNWSTAQWKLLRICYVTLTNLSDYTVTANSQT